MSATTAIEWTDKTWNPIVGCSIVSPGCTNCYAMSMAARIERMEAGRTHYAGTTQPSKAGPVWTGKLAQAPEHILTQPLRWKKPARIFVNSMGDLFHDDVPDEWIDKVFAIMALAPQHTFQVLTKRSAIMQRYINDPELPGRVVSLLNDQGPGWGLTDAQIVSACNRLYNKWPLSNLWLGVSAEDQARADERIPHLLATPAALRFVSAEPLLGPLTIFDMDGPIDVPEGMPSSLHWVIAGGESGRNARPAHPDWFRSLRDQCEAAGVPFFFKQHGEWIEVDGPRCKNISGDYKAGDNWLTTDGVLVPVTSSRRQYSAYSTSRVRRVGKKAAGNTLDGRQHLAFPQTTPSPQRGEGRDEGALRK